MADPILPYQEAIYTTLDEALDCEVYDHVPKGAAKPYVSIGRHIVSNADALNERKDDHALYLTVWSDADGQYEVLGIMGQIDDVLSNARPTLSSGRAVVVRVRNKTTNPEPDGRTYQGQVVVTCRLEH